LIKEKQEVCIVKLEKENCELISRKKLMDKFFRLGIIYCTFIKEYKIY